MTIGTPTDRSGAGLTAARRLLIGTGLLILSVSLLAVVLWPFLTLAPVPLPASYWDVVLAGSSTGGLLMGMAATSSPLF